MIYRNVNPEVAAKYKVGLDVLLKHLRTLPPQIEDLAYEFKQLISKRNQTDAIYELKETVRELFQRDNWITSSFSIDREFTIQVKIHSYSIYHNDTATDYDLTVFETNHLLNTPTVHRLPWEKVDAKTKSKA